MISCRGMTFDDKGSYSPPGQLDRGAQAHGSSANDQDRELERCHGLTFYRSPQQTCIFTPDFANFWMASIPQFLASACSCVALWQCCEPTNFDLSMHGNTATHGLCSAP